LRAALDVNATPTVFVNGKKLGRLRVPGASSPSHKAPAWTLSPEKNHFEGRISAFDGDLEDGLRVGVSDEEVSSVEGDALRAFQRSPLTSAATLPSG
jgi:hypothetical protein